MVAAGCLGSASDDSDETPDDGDEGENAGGEIDARFGYVQVAGDDSASIEADHTVQLLIAGREGVPVPEFYFEPTGLHVERGDTVKFELATPHHNVNAYHPAFGYERRVPEGAPAFSSPILGGGDAWYYTFEHEGVHDFTCAPHEIFGMAGRIVVGTATGPGAEPVGEAPGGEEARAPDFTSGLVLADPALDPETIVAEGSVSWSDLDPESKRLLVQFEAGAEH